MFLQSLALRFNLCKEGKKIYLIKSLVGIVHIFNTTLQAVMCPSGQLVTWNFCCLLSCSQSTSVGFKQRPKTAQFSCQSSLFGFRRKYRTDIESTGRTNRLSYINAHSCFKLHYCCIYCSHTLMFPIIFSHKYS